MNTTLSFIIIAIPALLIIVSGVFKLTGSKQVVETLTKVGVVQYTAVLGVAEILFALLFLWPVTNGIGFILLVAYFAGALAVDLSHKNKIVPPLMILCLLFVAEYLTHPVIFWQ
jgi:hypothetical protein